MTIANINKGIETVPLDAQADLRYHRKSNTVILNYTVNIKSVTEGQTVDVNY